MFLFTFFSNFDQIFNNFAKIFRIVNINDIGFTFMDNERMRLVFLRHFWTIFFLNFLNFRLL